MDSLAGYVATLGVGAAGQYLSQFLRPKVKIQYWLSHSFIYTIPNNQLLGAPNAAPALPSAPGQTAQGAPANFLLLTQSVTIQNFGRESAEWLEIVHVQKPDFFQLHPALNYTDTTSATGEHTLRVQSLAPKEFFTIQFLCYTHMPALSYIRSAAGHATAMPWLTARQYPRWVYALMWLVMGIGGGFCAYWIIKACAIVLRGLGAI